MLMFLGVLAKYQITEKNRVPKPNSLRAGTLTDPFTSTR